MRGSPHRIVSKRPVLRNHYQPYSARNITIPASNQRSVSNDRALAAFVCKKLFAPGQRNPEVLEILAACCHTVQDLRLILMCYNASIENGAPHISLFASSLFISVAGKFGDFGTALNFAKMAVEGHGHGEKTARNVLMPLLRSCHTLDDAMLSFETVFQEDISDAKRVMTLLINAGRGDLANLALQNALASVPESDRDGVSTSLLYDLLLEPIHEMRNASVKSAAPSVTAAFFQPDGFVSNVFRAMIRLLQRSRYPFGEGGWDENGTPRTHVLPVLAQLLDTNTIYASKLPDEPLTDAQVRYLMGIMQQHKEGGKLMDKNLLEIVSLLNDSNLLLNPQDNVSQAVFDEFLNESSLPNVESFGHYTAHMRKEISKLFYILKTGLLNTSQITKILERIEHFHAQGTGYQWILDPSLFLSLSLLYFNLAEATKHRGLHLLNSQGEKMYLLPLILSLFSRERRARTWVLEAETSVILSRALRTLFDIESAAFAKDSPSEFEAWKSRILDTMADALLTTTPAILRPDSVDYWPVAPPTHDSNSAHAGQQLFRSDTNDHILRCIYGDQSRQIVANMIQEDAFPDVESVPSTSVPVDGADLVVYANHLHEASMNSAQPLRSYGRVYFLARFPPVYWEGHLPRSLRGSTGIQPFTGVDATLVTSPENKEHPQAHLSKGIIQGVDFYDELVLGSHVKEPVLMTSEERENMQRITQDWISNTLRNTNTNRRSKEEIEREQQELLDLQLELRARLQLHGAIAINESIQFPGKITTAGRNPYLLAQDPLLLRVLNLVSYKEQLKNDSSTFSMQMFCHDLYNKQSDAFSALFETIYSQENAPGIEILEKYAQQCSSTLLPQLMPFLASRIKAQQEMKKKFF